MKNAKEDDDDEVSKEDTDEAAVILNQALVMIDVATEKMEQLHDLLEDDRYKKLKLDLDSMSAEIDEMLEEMEE